MLQGLYPSVANIMADAVATGLFVSLCDIQDAPTTINADGTLPLNVPGDWTTVISGIRCMNAPFGFGSGINANEVKEPIDTLALGPRHVLLESYFPAIHSGQRAVVDGVIYDILGAESDSQRTQTRLHLRQASLDGVASV